MFYIICTAYNSLVKTASILRQEWISWRETLFQGRFNRGEQGTTKGPDRTAINLQKDKEVKLKMCFPSYRTFYVDKGFKSEHAYSRNEHNCTQPFAVVVIPL